MMDADALATMLEHAEPYREETPSEEDMLDDYILTAHNRHDTLVEMGGRPTRKVLEKPAEKAIQKIAGIRIFDNDGGSQFIFAPDEDLTLNHWTQEFCRFDEELEQWTEFRNYQRHMERKPLLKIAFDPENTDQRLMEVIVRLNDWRDFQYYQQVKVGRAAMVTWQSARHIGKMIRDESVSDPAISKPETQHELNSCLYRLTSRQMKLETAQKHLTWIERQVPEILSEGYDLLDACPLQRQLEVKLQEQANAFHHELVNLKARQYDAMQSPPESASFIQRICYWGLEISRLMQEHWEWKVFLKWRRNQPQTFTKANIEEQQSSGPSSDLDIWVDYVAYRHFLLDRARNWVASWERLAKLMESNLKIYLIDQGLMPLKSSISSDQTYVKKFQKDVEFAEVQIQLAEQKLAKLSSEQSSSGTVRITQHSKEYPKLRPSVPESEPTEIIPKDCEVANLNINVRGTRELTKSPISRIPGSVQSSNVPNKGRIDINRTKLDTVADTVVPDQIIADDDTKMTDASNAEDTEMVDVQAPVRTNSSPAPRIDSMSGGTGAPRKSPSPILQVPLLRKTRYSTKPDQILASRVHKDTGKETAKRAKIFTEQEMMAILKTVMPPCSDAAHRSRSS